MIYLEFNVISPANNYDIKNISINMKCIYEYSCMHYVTFNKDPKRIHIMTSHNIIELLNSFNIKLPTHFIDNDLSNLFNNLEIKKKVEFNESDECTDTIMEDS
jgi:hypothetical protein